MRYVNNKQNKGFFFKSRYQFCFQFQHTKRHFQYLEDTFPHLLPDSKNHQKQTNNNNINNQNTTKFATQIVTNVESSDCLKTEARMKILSQACTDLQRLASIEVWLIPHSAVK